MSERNIRLYYIQVISTNADGSRDAASCLIDHCTARNDGAGRRVYSPGDSICRLTALCYTDRQLQDISTYTHGEAQTPLVRFVVDMFYQQIRNNTANRAIGHDAIMLQSLTSCCSCSIATARIATDHASFNRPHRVPRVHARLHPQTASRSVQSFLQGSRL